MNLPFEEKLIEENNSFILVERTFNKILDEKELVWHRDKEDRDIILKEGEEWYIQIDNELPVLMSNDNVYKVPSYTWHRIINKNRTKLIIEVKKYK